MIAGIGGIGINLFGNVAEQLGKGANATQVGAGIGQSFGSLVAEAATRTIDTLENAQTISMQALKGEADTREVVDAVMNAEQSLQAAIAIRDRIINAYLEISRMAI